MERDSDVRDEDNFWMTFSVRLVSYFRFRTSCSKANLLIQNFQLIKCLSDKLEFEISQSKSILILKFTKMIYWRRSMNPRSQK